MKTNLMNDPATLRAALVGYQVELSRLNAEKAKLESQLAGDQPAERKRNLSAAARKRISAAQRKRWAAYRENKKG